MQIFKSVATPGNCIMLSYSAPGPVSFVGKWYVSRICFNGVVLFLCESHTLLGYGERMCHESDWLISSHTHFRQQYITPSSLKIRGFFLFSCMGM